MQNEVKRLGFAGGCSYDLIFYLAVYLTAMEKKVLLLDNSPVKALSYCITSPRGMDSKILVYGEKLELLKDTSFDKVHEEYDYILTDFGMNLNSEELIHNDYRFLVTDTKMHNIDALQAMNKEDEEYNLIVRDITKGMNEMYLPMLLEHKGLKGKKNYYIYWDEKDNEASSVLQYSHKYNLDKLSPGINIFIREILLEISNTDKKALKTALKKIRRGGI